MANQNIQTTKATFYKNGEIRSSNYVVGHDNSDNYVVRYEFKTPTSGISKIGFQLDGSGLGWKRPSKETGVSKRDLYWKITKDGESFKNANGADTNYSHDGELVIDNYAFKVEKKEISLNPDQTYYLWIFAQTTDNGWYYWPSNTEASITISSDEGGIVKIYNNNGWKNAIPYIYNKGWQQVIPYVYKDNKWNIGVS